MMLKEEKELRKWIRENVRETSTKFEHEKDFVTDIKRMLRMTTALVRAVREDCAKVAEDHDRYYAPDNLMGIRRAKSIAAAIRWEGEK